MHKEFYPVAQIGDVPPGTGKAIQFGLQNDCVLFCTEANEHFVTGRLCPHQNEPLDCARLEGREVICRRHHLRFDLASGDCTNAGGYGLRTLEIRIDGNTIFVGDWVDD